LEVTKWIKKKINLALGLPFALAKHIYYTINQPENKKKREIKREFDDGSE